MQSSPDLDAGLKDAVQACVGNMIVIPIFGDFFLGSVRIGKCQHDCPSFTLISDAADSQTPTILHRVSITQ